MQVKKFEADSLQEALDKIKKELGPEAIILQTKSKKKGLNFLNKKYFEITAAISDADYKKIKEIENKITENSKIQFEKLSVTDQKNFIKKYDERKDKKNKIEENLSLIRPDKKITSKPYLEIADEEEKVIFKNDQKNKIDNDFLLKEISSLKQTINDIKSDQFLDKNLYAAQSKIIENIFFQEIFDQLISHGVERKYVLDLIKKSAFNLDQDCAQNRDLVFDSFANELMNSIQVKKLVDLDLNNKKKRLISFVGPTSVGKTSMIAKVAKQLQKKNQANIGLISLDCKKLCAFEELGTYAKIINSPWRSVNSIDDLRAALLDFSSLDFVLIDTSGISLKKIENFENYKNYFEVFNDIEIYLVLSSNLKELDLYNYLKIFLKIKINGLFFTKLDESMTFGSIYNIHKKSNLPLVAFSTGNLIPDDFENASKERIASLLIDF